MHVRKLMAHPVETRAHLSSVNHFCSHPLYSTETWTQTLHRDIEASGPEHAPLAGVPKPLLPVAGKPLVSHWTDRASAAETFDKVRQCA